MENTWGYSFFVMYVYHSKQLAYYHRILLIVPCVWVLHVDKELLVNLIQFEQIIQLK